MAINQLLRAARKRKHWSQSQAAEKCGVDLQTFYRWEHGLQAPHGFNLDHMCDAFDVPMESLGYVTQTETATQPTAQNSPLLTLAPEQIAVLLPLLEGGTMDQKKRNTLRAILVAAGATVTAPPALAESWERLATRKPSNINEQSLLYLRDLISTDALKSFAHYQTSNEVVPERIRLEIVNSQGQAAIRLGDLDQYTAYLQDGLSGASLLKSQKRYNEAITIFRQDVPSTWYKEPQLKTIIEHYAL